MALKGFILKGHPVWETYNGQIKQLRDQGLTLQAIGDKVGVTRERVRQILKAHYGTTQIPGYIYRYQLAKLIGCSEMQLTNLEKRKVVNPKHIGRNYLYDRDEAEKATLAVAQIQLRRRPITFICNECGKAFKRQRSYVIYRTKIGQRLWFCSRRCLGKYVGRKYGFAAHPENTPKTGIKRRKWDWEEVRKLREETGWGSRRIGQALGIPEPTVDVILVKLFGKPLPKVKRLKTPVQHPIEKECIGCGAMHTRRSLFCSTKCYDRIRSLVKYYEGMHLGGRKHRRKVKVHCFICGAEVERISTSSVHLCDEHLREYRKQVGQRFRTRRQEW